MGNIVELAEIQKFGALKNIQACNCLQKLFHTNHSTRVNGNEKSVFLSKIAAS